MLTFKLLVLSSMPILQQLQLEEALLRADHSNWCLINQGSPPAIVMGISGKVAEHINAEKQAQRQLPIIRRFSGGGTVVVDNQTCFYTLIGTKSLLPMPCTPQHLLQWTEKLYAPAFANKEFALCENDYVIGEKKFGGNAQYICKDRWLQHSSLLWDYDTQHMEHLLLPPKMPRYRQKRPHDDFLCRLRDFFETPNSFKQEMLKAMSKKLNLIETALSEVESIITKDHRKATCLIES